MLQKDLRMFNFESPYR